MTHGTRATYQRFRCRCLPCTAANAAYQQALRRLRARGQLPAHTLVASDAALKAVHSLLVEGFTSRTLAARMGLQCQRLRFYADRVTLARYQAIRRFYQTIMLEEGDPADA